jgi:hypothetical protein
MMRTTSDLALRYGWTDHGGQVDIEKVKPMLFNPEINTYHGVGRLLGRAFSIGKDIRAR